MNSKQTPLLFVHNAGPTHVHDRDHKTKTKIRQHVMLDIGRKRRKRLRNPQLEMVFQFSDRRHMPALVYPFWHQHPLDVLESHWGRDMFSAYGIMLMLNEGRNPVSTDRSTERFIFPFAFQKSPFLRHYAQLIIRPGQLAGVPHEKPTRLKMMALERSMDAISCVETALAGTNLENPSTELVILAIIAVISFNLISSDRDQALLHIWGLESLIAALGDSFTLRDHDEIRLMIFWVDVTTSLLHDSIPRFPLPSDLVPVVPPVELPLPLRTLMILRSKADKNISHVLSCMMDLNAIASLIESELTVRGDVLWGESVLLGLWLNPVAHRLLDRPPVTDISYRPSPISEALRQGALLWVIWIQRRYHAYPGSPTAIVQKLLSLLTQPDWSDVLTDTDLMSVHLWLLVLCGINCDVPAASPNLAGMIPLRMRQMGWDNWSEVMMYVRQMPWTHAIDVAATQLAERVERTNLLSIN